jgi:hypothetical protein
MVRVPIVRAITAQPNSFIGPAKYLVYSPLKIREVIQKKKADSDNN